MLPWHHERVIWETDNLYAIQAWHEYKKGKIVDGKKKELEDLCKRDDDPNLKLEVRLIPPYCNRITIYLAKNGGETRIELVVKTKSFESVMEIWYDDIGLGSGWARLVNKDDEDGHDASDWQNMI